MSALAYIDPGTGASASGILSMIVPAIGVFLGFLLVSLRKLIRRILDLCRGVLGKSRPVQSKSDDQSTANRH